MGDTMGDTISWIRWGIQYSLVNLVWDTVSTGGTIFPGGVRYSLFMNNVCRVRYSLGYKIHSDTGLVATVPLGFANGSPAGSRP